MSQEGKILELMNLIGIINEEINIYKAKILNEHSNTILGLERRMTEAENAIKQIDGYLKQYYEGT